MRRNRKGEHCLNDSCRGLNASRRRLRDGQRGPVTPGSETVESRAGSPLGTRADALSAF